MKKYLFATLMFVTLLAGTLAWAKPFHSDSLDNSIDFELQEDRMAHRLEWLTVILELTDTQRVELENLLVKFFVDSGPLQEKIRTARKALWDAKNAETFDESDFRIKARKLAELRTDLLVEFIKIRHEALSFMTYEQQQKAKDLRGILSVSNFTKRTF
jgi:Spy/CpxP family protein refolding chaperone